MIGNMSTPTKDWDARRGGIIRKRRQALGWDQRELAGHVGVHVNSVQRWEAGTQWPGRHLGRLEAVLDLHLDDEPERRPAIPASLLREIMATDSLTDGERRSVIAAVEATLAKERGEKGASLPSALPPAEPERRRPAS